MTKLDRLVELVIAFIPQVPEIQQLIKDFSKESANKMVTGLDDAEVARKLIEILNLYRDLKHMAGIPNLK